MGVVRGNSVGLLFYKGWLSKAIFGTVFALLTAEKFSRWHYGIPVEHNANLVNWPWWNNVMEQRRERARNAPQYIIDSQEKGFKGAH